MKIYSKPILSVFGGMIAGIHLVMSVEAYYVYPNSYVGFWIFFTILLLNTAWLSYSAISIAINKSVAVVLVISIIIFPIFFLFSHFAYPLFDLFHFKKELYQYSFIILTLLILPLVIYVLAASALARGSLGKILIFSFLVVANGMFYYMEARGSKGEERKYLQAEREGFNNNLRLFQKEYRCLRTITFLKIEGDQKTQVSRNEIFKASIRLDEKEPLEISYDPSVGTENLMKNPTHVYKIAIRIMGADKQTKLPVIYIQEKCPFFLHRTFGCIDFECSACIEATGF
ncbi:hypothetical protein EHO58_19435 [Leptospira selangorensis]|uniref:hypothetical protein n=1 Tax=Leptospira selangorensis TaxID=2484982 RepID=UPI00108492F2|nr:hypothetical protein [Leptospira selangorensis]TGJ99808.1 hypothetical protein EHO58_19435 [Leptospira selangorensis]